MLADAILLGSRPPEERKVKNDIREGVILVLRPDSVLGWLWSS